MTALTRTALLIALGYYVGAKIGFALTLAPVPVSPLWPPNAILLAGLTLTAPRSWPTILTAVFGAHLAVQFQSGVPPSMVLCWFISNTTEALIGALLLRRCRRGTAWFESFRDSARFLLVVSIAAFVSTFLDAGFVALNGWGNADFLTNVRTRFGSNVLASITLVPVILTTADQWRRLAQLPGRAWLEAAAGLVTLITVSWVVFVVQGPGPESSVALLYAPLPLLVGAAIRFGPWGASLSMLACALVAICGAILGQGPFANHSALENARGLQQFLVVAWIPIMALASVVRERERADAGARFSEEQLAMTIEAAQVGRWDWDVARQELQWSEITRRIYEVPLDGPIDPQAVHELVHPEDRHLLNASIEDALAGRPIDVEFRVRFPDGRIKWILSRGESEFDAEGRPIRIRGIKVDTTARKCAELDIQEKRRQLAQAARTLVAGELSVALAHEVNQPLAAILMNATVARQSLLQQPLDVAELERIVEEIAADNRRAAALISELGMRVRKDAPNWTALDINDVVTSFLDVARLDMISRGVSATKTLADRLPPVIGDRLQLQQVLLNLVINACEAMEPLQLSERRLHLATSVGRDGGVRVSVSDNGVGIGTSPPDRVFEPFFTSKTQRPGLGLAICSSIVAAHSGRLEVENRPGSGATFVFWLPAADVAQHNLVAS